MGILCSCLCSLPSSKSLYIQIDTALQEALEDPRVADRFDTLELERFCNEWFESAPTGALTIEQFTQFVAKCNLFKGEADTSDVHMRALFRKIDLDDDGTIDFHEFMLAIAVMIRGEPDEKISFTFALLDVENRGEVCFEEWMSFATTFTSGFDSNRLREMFAEFDVNQDGMLSSEEFKELSYCHQQNLHDQDSGIHAFNAHPRRDESVVKLCKGHSVPADDDKAVSTLLFSLCTQKSSICLSAIGEYLGQEKLEKRLEAYMRICNFKDLDLDDGLRALSDVIIISGEAQVISRILSKFSTVYQRDNPDRFDHEDKVFLVSFSLMMLNTDLHNPAIPAAKKMKKAEYLRNLSGQGINVELLEGLYDRIKNCEIKLSSGQSNDAGSLTTFLNNSVARMSIDVDNGVINGEPTFAGGASVGSEELQLIMEMETSSHAEL